jgi:hypothetical protein
MNRRRTHRLQAHPPSQAKARLADLEAKILDALSATTDHPARAMHRWHLDQAKVWRERMYTQEDQVEAGA